MSRLSCLKSSRRSLTTERMQAWMGYNPKLWTEVGVRSVAYPSGLLRTVAAEKPSDEGTPALSIVVPRGPARPLRVPGRALDPPAHHQRHRVHLRDGTAAHQEDQR